MTVGRATGRRRSKGRRWRSPAASIFSAGIQVWPRPKRGIRWHGARLLLVVALLVAIVPFGATGPFAMPIAAIAACFAGVAACLLPSEGMGRRWLERPAAYLSLALALYVLVQSKGGAHLLPAYPVWGSASELLQAPLPGVASVAPSTSLASLPAILSPFLLFIAGLRVASDDAAALGLLRIVGCIGGCVAVFGLAQFALTPDSLLFSEKLAYRDSLTLVFVNRNTAAAYLGCTIVTLLALLRIEVGPGGLGRAVAALLVRRSGAMRGVPMVAYLVFIAVAVVALLLTKSRAGIVCSAVAIGFYALLTAASSTEGRRLANLAATMLGVAVAAFVFAIFGGRVLNRSTAGIMDDSRFCVMSGLWRAVRDSWPVGTGPGTFELVFRSYRDPACGLYGTWKRAHNFFLEGSITLGAAFWIALVVALSLLLIVLVRGVRQRRRYRCVPIAGLAVVLLLVLHDLVDFSLQIPGLASNTALLLATCCSIALRRRLGEPRHGRENAERSFRPDGRSPSARRSG